MTARSERDAAYFTLLRAIEERDQLLRYREYLQRELERLDAFSDSTHGFAEPVHPRMRRPVDLTTKPVLEAVGRRRAVALDELQRIDRRIADAERFVEECELELQQLR